ncbi:diguanylate cyclase [Acetobacterium fimetarium]|uniref:Diguanylate cyclase n=1 Tax=Acetobacterium fimetarium TaxID=52691 RepID=A0ABR6WWJ4_9FIRM|nr:diguanylate cyclase [Acetobacterium fimetarium]MBC3804957.1 diguanylate cyclase [Acetobacterium fimetarium]
MRKRRILLLLVINILILPILSGCSNQRFETYHKAQNGQIDLSQLHLENEAIDLDGEWEFFWNQLLEPTEVDQGELSGYVSFPSSWNKYVINGKTISGDGYATYRLTFNSSDDRILALKIPKVRTAYKLWVNNNLTAAAGEVGKTEESMTPRYLPQVVSFNAHQGENEIVIQMSNFHLSSGGLLNSIQLGGESQLLGLRYRGIAFDLFIFGALMMMGIYHLALFFFRKKDPSPLYFGLFCILIAVRTLMVGEAFLFYLWPDLDFVIARKIQTLTYYLGVPLILMFFKSMLPDYFHNQIVRVTQILAGAYALVVLLTPTNIYAVINPFYQIWSIFLIVYLFAMLIRIASHSLKENWLIILGGLALILTSIVDIITLSVWISDSWPPFLKMIFQSDNSSSTGQLLFAIAISLLLAKNFSDSLEYKTVMGEKLTEINNHLDDLVFQRTRELTASNEKVEQQNFELELINQELQKISLRDPLTELWNRRKYDETIQLEWRRCMRYKRPISLLFIDVDYFKNYNDQYGHVAGDECLIKIGETLRTALSRPTDMVVRYGGEEFIVLLLETSKDEAIHIADVLLQKINALGIPHFGSVVKDRVTVSIGVSCLIPDASSNHEELVKIADTALYHAKTNGRNQVQVFGE